MLSGATHTGTPARPLVPPGVLLVQNDDDSGSGDDVVLLAANRLLDAIFEL